MPGKAQMYAEVATETAGRISGSFERWTGFLETAARLYKYPFHEQLMIYAQRPEATACASFETWNETMRRYVKRGSKGIALIDPETERLRYVFDVSDTGTRENSRRLYLWEFNENEHFDAVSKALEQKYDVSGKNGIAEQLEVIAAQLADEFWNAHQRDILSSVEDSFLSDYDDFDVNVSFHNAATVSATYMLLSRCGLDPKEYFTPEDYLSVFDFNTPEAVYALGSAISETSEEILRTVETAVKNYERERRAERIEHHANNLQPERGLSDSRPDVRTPDSSRQVRQNENELSQNPPPDSLEQDDTSRQTERASSGDRQLGEQPIGDNADRDVSQSGSDREAESRESNGVDGDNEQPEVAGRGDNSERDDIRLDEPSWEQISLFPTEEEQIRILDEIQQEASVPPFYADYTLIKEQNPDDVILYQVGDFFEMYGEDAEQASEMLGLRLAHRTFGDERVPMCGIPSYRLDDYVEELRGKYDVTISAVTEGAQREVSRRISVDHEAEIAIDRSEAEFGADGWRAIGGVSPERENYSFMVAEEYNALQDAHPEDIILYQEDGFFEIYADSAEKASQILEFPRGTASFGDRRVRNLSVPANELEENVEKLRESFGVTISAVGENGERSSYSLAKVEVEREQTAPRKAKFEQSDIDELLIAWNSNPESKRAVYEYMLEHERERDTAAWLANEYGADPAQPLLFTSPAVEEELKMPWAKVQRRIAQLIHSGDFMPEAEREQAEVEQAEQPVETPIQAHYTVGDTVYLDNTAFEIAEIGLFDVQLLDPTLAYPVFRTESKERLETLLQNDERNAHLFAEQEQEQPAPDYTSETVAVYPAESNHLPFDVVVETLHFDEPQRPEPAITEGTPNVEQNASATPPIPAENFRITDDHLGEGGAKAKFRMNMDAINLLKELEFDGRQAAPDEQAILSRYVGWGGLADAFDESKNNWSSEFQELYAALTPEEYAAARASTLNAHYTSPTVIKAIYEAVGNMGYETGNILEPSMGVGNFFGLLPENMQSSRLYGVELDSLTGRIAKQLYPKADIKVAGFETTDRRDFFDLAVGNVPFGNYKVNDRAYNKLGFSIHDYFFAKTLDQVRAGGVIAFVTSRYTMDKQSPEVRKYIAERAELLGAIRLPNNAFKANAGTEVTSDIIFLQKRDRPIAIDEDWIHLGQTADGFAINSYFVDHPEMVLGTLSAERTQYGKEDITVEPIEGANLAEQLSAAIKNIRGIYREAELPDLGEDEKVTETIPADPSVRNYSYAIVDGEVYFRENSVMVKPDLNATAKERIKGLVELRDCVHKLIDEQTDGYSDSEIKDTQQELNRIYDRFTAKFGLINTRPNQAAFSQDSAYYLLCSLEILDENKNLARKADIFTKRTIKPHEVVTSVDTAAEALALSVSEKACVDISYMSELTGKDVKTLASDLRGVIFKDYAQDFSGRYTYRTADDFLSGNVRQKLKYYESIADSTEGDKHQAVLDNIEALKAAQPKDLDASEIEVRLGATWIDKEYIRQFMFDTFEPPYYLRYKVEVNFSDVTAEWSISNKSAVADRNFSASMNYGTGRLNPYKILEDTLNLRDVRVYDTVKDTNGNDKRVLNEKETTLAQQKQQAIKDAFRDWIWKNPERREKLVTKYNELFNSTRPREYDGSHINFVGMNPEINLRDHQKNAIAHVLYGGNTLLAHEVGAGKTFEMAAAAMESKRLGLCRKSLFVVPNHLTEQWASEFLRLYPSANILAATKKDFEPQNRKKFCARIATGDYDAVIIGHSQFEKIPVSYERQERLLREQINDITEGIEELKDSNAERFTIKQLEKTKKSLETRLEKLRATDRKDDVVTFEQLGVDRLFVDEAHNYKNLFLYTKMRNVAGLSTTDAQKSSDMFMKCRYLDEITDSKGVIFATGTPVSNSMTELYTMQRYLQYDLLKQLNMTHFDCWASTFGETTTALELAPEGTGYRARTRFAKFFNLPELMNIFKETADIKTADQLHLPTPEAVFHNVVAQPTDIQKEMVKELSQRAAKVHSGAVDSSVDNMLKITSDGRKLGLDQRIINPNLPDEPQSKVNQCVDNIFKIWEDGKDDKLTQLVFCDLSTPKNTVAEKTAAKSIDNPELNALLRLTEDDGGEKAFSVYDDIRAKLTAKGIPKEEIAFIHEANTEVKKKELFSKVRSGQVRVLMGSTFKMGAGTNVRATRS